MKERKEKGAPGGDTKEDKGENKAYVKDNIISSNYVKKIYIKKTLKGLCAGRRIYVLRHF